MPETAKGPENMNVTMYWRRLRRSESAAFWLFLAPWLAGFLGLTLGPMLFSLFAAFTRWNGVGSPQWIGLQNFRVMFTSDLDFWPSLGHTFLYAGARVALGTVLALALAAMVNTRIAGRTFFRTVFFLPAIVTGVPLFVVWSWMLDPSGGVLNYLLGKVGIQGPEWLASSTWAIPALVLMSLTATGGAMIVFLAGLQDIPLELRDAALVDGAGWWQRFRRITVPLLSPVILFNVIMGLIGSLQVFAEPYVMTGGGPEHTTYFLGLYLYNEAFWYSNVGYASALAWVQFLVVVVLTVVVLRFSRRHVHYLGS
ncbi:carbohydrate ABC transporter permease [Streptomyces lomondensis]|uniref:Spermidine/putrescine ABC transporter permease n=1 Tax=Streptomyces lomondensis TaxID=68229 RepID=A0ABQ2WY67_9ACTN|nr:sugar ABC transporter permease [Streptomyces lomondensis]MCF0079106.1 sugar ABC transporter permease [Streptomyces lomondensis]GGW82647.1 spermidine/putrescine ABC transporter permease [Streptomyces lomondensis]